MPECGRATARYPGHLARVSRSFAACIAELEPPLAEWVGLGYLLCRLLDTVEDAPWASPEAQQAHFAAALRLCAAPAAPDVVAAWAAGLPDAIAPGERALLDDAPALLADLHALPPAPRAAMQVTLARMGRGMQGFARRRKRSGEVRLRDVMEVNRYCYVVAGVVGHLLSDLYACAQPKGARALDPVDAVHFGLFLQKVNLLKDRAEDEREGRFWLPDADAIRQSLRANAEGAARYLCAIDRAQRGFRLFCAFSLVLGAYSLQLYDGRAAAKLDRAETLALFAQLRDTVDDQAALDAALAAALAQLPPAEGGDDGGPGKRTGDGADATRGGDQAEAAATAAAEDDWTAWTGTLGSCPLNFRQARSLGMA